MPRKVIVAGLVSLTLLAHTTATAEASHTDVAGHWRLDEGSGQSARDASGHGLHGRLGNSPAADSADPFWTRGRVGPSALDFRAGARSVFVADSSLLEPDHVTAEAWVKRSGSPGQFAYVLAKGAQSCLAASYAIYSGFDGGVTFYTFDGSSYSLASGAGTGVCDGAWHHVAGTFDGSVMRFYLDGVEVGPSTAAGPIAYPLPSNEAFYIGNFRGTCDKPFTGAIDDVRVWSRALGPDEILEHANEPPSTGSPDDGGTPGGPGGQKPGARTGSIVERVSCARQVSFRRIARRGLRVSVNVSRPGRVQAFVLLRGKRIGRSPAVVARKRGNVVVLVRLQRAKVRRELRRHGRLRLSCRAAGTGQRAVAAKRRLLLRP
jgi:hypothetical protein